MYVDEPPMDGNIPGFNISKIDIFPFGVYQRSFRLIQGDFSKDIHQRSRLLCFTQNDHTGQTEFKICPLFKVSSINISNPSIDGAKLHRFSELLIPFDAFLCFSIPFYPF